MIRLDERALREDDAYRAAYALAMAHREHMEALYRGLFDAVVANLKVRFAPVEARDCRDEIGPSQPIHQTMQ